MTGKPSLPSEWVYRIDAEDIGSSPQSYFISANEEELKALARRLNVEKLEEVNASLTITRQAGGLRLHVQGRLKAKVVQKCVITLEPVEGWIEEDFEAFYADTEQTVSFVQAQKDRQSKKGHQEVEVSEEMDDPEPLIDGAIEVGELVTQYLSLAINPYPHIDGAQYEYGDEGAQGREPSPLRKNPFEALKNWKDKR